MKRCRFLLLATLALACNEKTPQLLVWEIVPATALPNRASLRAVQARTPQAALAVGDYLPEHSTFFLPVALSLEAGSWNEEPLYGHEGESVQLRGVALAADGTYWVVGHANPLPDDPLSARPLVYQRNAGAWQRIEITNAGDLAGVTLAGVACVGSGAAFELRAVGSTPDQQGICLRFDGATWSRMDMPRAAPPAWNLTTIGRSPWGIWFAAGAGSGAPGGAVYRDAGDGWHLLEGPPRPELQFAALAFDATGDPWFAANDASGELLEGLLYTYRQNRFEAIDIHRITAGQAHLFALGFDAQGYGWVGGGRPPDDPFLAGNSGGSLWKEVLVDPDFGMPTGGGEGIGEGGDVHSLVVLSKQDAFAVGAVEETGAEGYLEQFPRVFHYQPVPAGDPDAPVGP